MIVGSFLQTRTWKGLEQKLGETPVTTAIEGRSGVPVCYTHELDTTSSSTDDDK